MSAVDDGVTVPAKGGVGPGGPPASDARVEVAAPAKINLALLVGPRRPDGYREISSPMLPVTLADLVTARWLPARTTWRLGPCASSSGASSVASTCA